MAEALVAFCGNCCCCKGFVKPETPTDDAVVGTWFETDGTGGNIMNGVVMRVSKNGAIVVKRPEIADKPGSGIDLTLAGTSWSGGGDQIACETPEIRVCCCYYVPAQKVQFMGIDKELETPQMKLSIDDSETVKGKSWCLCCKKFTLGEKPIQDKMLVKAISGTESGKEDRVREAPLDDDYKHPTLMGAAEGGKPGP